MDRSVIADRGRGGDARTVRRTRLSASTAVTDLAVQGGLSLATAGVFARVDVRRVARDVAQRLAA